MGGNPSEVSVTESGPRGAPDRAQVSDGGGRLTGETTEAGLWQLGSPAKPLELQLHPPQNGLSPFFPATLPALRPTSPGASPLWLIVSSLGG